MQMAAAFVGLVVGAGFASGQEIMQYFTMYGWESMYGILFAVALFSFLGSRIALFGQRLQAISHKEVIQHMAGPYLSIVIDIFLVFLLFGVAIVMFAGAGAMFEQIFHVQAIYGQMLLMLMVVLTLMLNIKKILVILAAVIPYFLILTIVIAIYAIVTADNPFAEHHNLTLTEPKVSSHWLISAFLYVSYNIALSVPMLAVLGGIAKHASIASRGGMFGGLLLGLLIFFVNIAMLVKMNAVSGKALPMLALASDIHSVVGILFAIIILLKMYTTAVGCLYAFIVRFVEPTQNYYKWFVIASSGVAFCASFAGFTVLINKLYSIMGYIGLFLILIILKSTFTKSRNACK